VNKRRAVEFSPFDLQSQITAVFPLMEDLVDKEGQGRNGVAVGGGRLYEDGGRMVLNLAVF